MSDCPDQLFIIMRQQMGFGFQQGKEPCIMVGRCLFVEVLESQTLSYFDRAGCRTELWPDSHADSSAARRYRWRSHCTGPELGDSASRHHDHWCRLCNNPCLFPNVPFWQESWISHRYGCGYPCWTGRGLVSGPGTFCGLLSVCFSDLQAKRTDLA